MTRVANLTEFFESIGLDDLKAKDFSNFAYDGYYENVELDTTRSYDWSPSSVEVPLNLEIKFTENADCEISETDERGNDYFGEFYPHYTADTTFYDWLLDNLEKAGFVFEDVDNVSLVIKNSTMFITVSGKTDGVENTVTVEINKNFEMYAYESVAYSKVAV